MQCAAFGRIPWTTDRNITQLHMHEENQDTKYSTQLKIGHKHLTMILTLHRKNIRAQQSKLKNINTNVNT